MEINGAHNLLGKTGNTLMSSSSEVMRLSLGVSSVVSTLLVAGLLAVFVPTVCILLGGTQACT